MLTRFCQVGLMGCAGLIGAVVSARETSARVDVIRFDAQIRPILAAKCMSCHGPDEESRQADLRLDTVDGLFGDRDGYAIIFPGKPEASELYRRITSEVDTKRMPPADSERHLTVDEIALLKRWIEAGAPWQTHWAFVSPSRPPLPDVKQSQWVRTPIDRFVLSCLEAEGLSPSPEADRRTLIRRATFDLTGLPPRVEDVNAFLLDKSDDAYEKVLERLLASKNYGEHRARYWLDLARYGDTHGLHLDNYREMWPFRDWVIRAFNQNLPYNQFLIDQLAGDLLPEPMLDQQVASGFIRNHVTTNEGGSISEEVYVRNVVDCVDTFGTAILGLTLGCAVCHDHKYDPVTQKDFYQLFAFFNSLDSLPLDGNVKDPAPTVRVPTADQAAVMFNIRADIERLRRKRDERLNAADSTASFSQWLNSLQPDASRDAALNVIDVVDGLTVQCKFDEGAGDQVSDARQPKKPGRLVGKPRWKRGRVGDGIEFTEGSYVDLGERGRFKAKQAFSYGAWIRVPLGAKGAVLARTEAKEGIKGYDVSVLSDGRVTALLSDRWPGYAIKVVTKCNLLQPDTWHHVFVTYDGSKLVQGLTLYIDGQPQQVDIKCDSLKESRDDLEVDKPLLVGRRDSHEELVGGQIDEVRLYDRRLTLAEVQAIYLVTQLPPLSRAPRQTWTEEQLDVLQQLYVVRYDSVFSELTTQIEALQKRLAEKELEVATTLVFRERRRPRPAYVLTRGQYDHRGERVERDTPPFLPPMSKDLPRDRLGLARWLVSPEHPLTSRVAVNQLWQQLFGAGLVKTSEDFGTQGSPPSHPELLDWLAVEFRECGWDVKAMLKLIMISATYRQSSAVAAELVECDPENRLVARGPRFRLDAEMLRDQALAISGLLVNRVGGPSVKPPQPSDLWKVVGYPESNTVDFVPDVSPDKIYRRSMYTFWKRTAPPPQMSTFDAPSRESCIARRERTNTPLQALLLMNEPQYMEAARRFAERILLEALRSPRERAAWAFEQATMRPPDADELFELVAALNDFQATYQANTDAAQKLIESTGSPLNQSTDAVTLATWTMMSNLLLNLDEMVNKE